MSQAVITKAFSEWKAQQAVNNQPVTLDEFIFAYIPDLDVTKPIDNTEGIPAADKIVHRQAVSKSGVVNANSVVYSVTLGADVGDFSFNWIGLINKATSTLGMIIHAPAQSKIKNASGQQGNVLVRSMLMEYSGAVSATNITTPAETWQIDFTARLAAMDERQRLENIDLYGAAAFFDTGYLVAKSGTQYFVTKGAGYVAGLRTELAANQNIAVSTKPVKVWLDVSWSGTLTSEWAVKSKITVATNLTDYVESGVKHYVFAVASIDASGNISDLRPKGSLNDQAASDALKTHEQSRNHPDATTAAKGFTQLSSATDSTSESLAATPKAVKAVSDAVNEVKKSLGTAASKDVQTSKDDITAGRLLVNGGALALRTTLAGAGRPFTDFNDLPANSVSFGYDNATNTPGFTGSVLDYAGSNGNYRVQLAAQYNGNGNRIAFRTRNGDAAGAWNPWGELYHTRNKPTASDVDAVSATNGGTFQKEVGFNGGLWVRSKTGMYSGNDAAGYTSNNMLLKSWYGIGFYCTLTDANQKETGLTGYINTRTGRLEMKEQIIPGNYTNFDARYQAKGNYTPAGQAYTKAESDGRYPLKTATVIGVRVSARGSIGSTGGTADVDSPVGSFITGRSGSNGDVRYSVWYTRALQINVNGTWKTITA